MPKIGVRAPTKADIDAASIVLAFMATWSSVHLRKQR